MAGRHCRFWLQLVDKSMIRAFLQQAVSGNRAPRDYIHGLLRAYLLEKLNECGDANQTGRQHAVFFADLADAMEPSFYSGNSWPALYQLNEEHSNLRAALHWALDEGNDPLLGLHLAGALGRFWHLAGHWREGRDWLQAALAQTSQEQPLTAQALVMLGELHHALEENEAAVQSVEQGLAMWRELGNPSRTAWALFQLGTAKSSMGEYDQAALYLAESLGLYREQGNPWAIATVLNQMSSVASSRGDYPTAGHLLDEALPLMRQVQGIGGGVAVSLNVLGRIVLGQGEVAVGHFAFRRSLGDLKPPTQSGRTSVVIAQLGAGPSGGQRPGCRDQSLRG